MKLHRFLLLLSALLFILLIQFHPDTGYSNENGAPSAVSGSPGDNGKTCAKSGCHTGNAVVNIPNLITTNVPPTGYVAGTTYTITATCVQSGINKWGFEISPQDNSGNLLGQLVITNTTQTKIVNSRYVTQKTAGSNGNGSKTWSFNWVAPAAGTGDVTFYGSFNYANNNGGDSGDHIKTSSLVIPEYTGTTGISDQDNPNQSLKVFPNPVVDKLVVHFPVSTSGRVKIEIFDLTGKLVKILEDANMEAGSYHPDFHVTGLPSGIYFVDVTTVDKNFSQKIVVL